MKKVLIDASSAILLFKVELFECLLNNYDVIMVDTVYREVSKPGYAGAALFRKLALDHRFTVGRLPGIRPAGRERLPAPTRLDRGERDTISGFAAGMGDFIIIDDGRAARYLRDNNLPFINALLVLRLFCLQGKISANEYSLVTERLLAHGRYSAFIVDYASHCTKDVLRVFWA